MIRALATGLLLMIAAATTQGVLAAAPSGAAFGGTVWIDAMHAAPGAVVRALIEGAECGRATTILPQDGQTTYSMTVASETEKHGCAREGSAIVFEVSGVVAHETALWSAASPGTFQPLNLTTGGRFAAYSGTIEGARTGDLLEVRMADGHVCGSQTLLNIPGAGAPMPYGIQVKSVGLVPGCADTGSQLTFLLNGSALAAAVDWTPGFHTLNLVAAGATSGRPGSLTPVALPPTGDGASGRHGHPDFVFSLALLSLAAGLAAVAGRMPQSPPRE